MRIRQVMPAGGLLRLQDVLSRRPRVPRPSIPQAFRLRGRIQNEPGEATMRHRDDIQGMRAVAVLLVVLGHAGVSFLQGGFVGVDVFFVLSGFLITGLLLNEAARERAVSLVGFYVRRARRILPAATLTLLATIVAAHELLNVVRAREAVEDSIAAALFTANIHFSAEGTDYFAQGQPPSPVQHYWSLAVEEQFYVVWPALVALVLFGLGLRQRGDRRARQFGERQMRRLLVIVGAIAVLSLGWSIYSTADRPESAYFSTFARAWELAMGAAIAVGARHLIKLTPSVRAVLGWLGVAAMVAAAVLYSPQTPFPGAAALLPTLGAAFVIIAGLGDQQPRGGVGRLLALAPMRYVGDRSYTLYLWHWPVLIIAEQYHGEELTVATKLALVGGAFLLSIVTYRLFEDPLRRLRWNPPARALVLAPVSILLVLVFAGAVRQSIDTSAARAELTAEATPPLDPYASPAPTPDASADAGTVEEDGSLRIVAASARAAERGAPIPANLRPPVAELEQDAYVYPEGCVANDGQTSSRLCRLGDASSRRTIALVGDSHAQMWMPTLLAMAERDGWAVVPLSKSRCVPDLWLEGNSAECRTWHKWVLGQIERLEPTATIVTGAFGGAAGERADAILNGIGATVEQAQPASEHVVVLGNTPRQAKQAVDCLLARNADMRTCSVEWTEDRLQMGYAIATQSQEQGAAYIDNNGWFCFEYRCPMVVDGTIVYMDGAHLTTTYAERLAEPFRKSFTAAIRG